VDGGIRRLARAYDPAGLACPFTSVYGGKLYQKFHRSQANAAEQPMCSQTKDRLALFAGGALLVCAGLTVYSSGAKQVKRLENIQRYVATLDGLTLRLVDMQWAEGLWPAPRKVVQVL
jgi:hypothetical protein